MSEYVYEGEVIAAHPSRVAQADQVQAAEPRKDPSKVILSDWLPTDKVYIIDLDALTKLTDHPFRF